MLKIYQGLLQKVRKRHPVISSFSNILQRKQELVALLYLCSCQRVANSLLYLVLLWVGLWSMILAVLTATFPTLVYDFGISWINSFVL